MNVGCALSGLIIYLLLLFFVFGIMFVLIINVVDVLVYV